MAVSIIHLVCATCGAGVNKVERGPGADHLAAQLANSTDSPCSTPECPGGEVEVKP